MKSKHLIVLILTLAPFITRGEVPQDDRKWLATGQVIDSKGQPIVGAGVIIPGTLTGSVTDIDGNFNIEVSDSRNLLEVSSLGYETVIVKAEKSQMKIVLEDESLFIDQIVVTGYGNGIRKESLTSSIATIDSGNLARSAGSHVSTALAGKIAGVNFRQMNGEPGAATSISVRNMGTALFVIDGVQSTQGSFNNLDFNDIESISVLKDASAAIYGVQAANGVIVVTTKSGKRKEGHQINVNAYGAGQSWFRYPKPASTEQYIKGLIQSATITGQPGNFTTDDLAAYRSGARIGFNWYDYVIRKSSPQYYLNANATGGTEKLNYYISLGYLDQESIIRNYGGFQRYNIQFNLDAQVTRRLKVGMRFNGRYEDYNHPAVPGDDIWAAIFAIWRNPPTSRPYANENPEYPAVTSNTVSTNFAILNYDRSGYWQDTYRIGQLIGNFEYDIIDGLKLKGTASYYYGSRWYECQEYTYNLYEYDAATDTYPIAYSLTNPFRQRTVSFQQQIMGQAQLTYDRQFGKHNISVLAAAEAYHEINPMLDTWSRPESNYINTIDFASLEKYTDKKNDESARAGFAGRINYNYGNRYYIELSGRYDGSYKFRTGSRWTFLPSLSIGWRPSEERFWKNSSMAGWFNSFKIRASYGTLGSDDISGLGAFDYLAGYDYGSGGAVLDGNYVTGVQTSGIPTTTVSWIKVNMFDAGIDFGFLNSRVSGSIDYFYNLRSGLVSRRYDQLIPSEVGFDLPLENLESEAYTGIDGNILYTDRSGDFSWSAGANFTYSRHLTHHQYNPQYENSWHEYRNSAWERYSGITWGYISDGQFQSWDEIYSCTTDIDGKSNSTLRPGDIKYKDFNKDGIINEMDQRPIGYSEGTLPSLNFGLNVSFGWKGIDIAADFTGGAFGTYHVDYEICKPFWDGGNTAAFILENSWRLQDITDPDSELIPGAFPTPIVGNSSHSNYWVSDFWYRNVTYIKLKNLEIGYSLPQKWMDKCRMEKCRIYLFGQNLFSIDNLGLFETDPEIANASGIVYPTTRLYGAGLKVTF